MIEKVGRVAADLERLRFCDPEPLCQGHVEVIDTQAVQRVASGGCERAGLGPDVAGVRIGGHVGNGIAPGILQGGHVAANVGLSGGIGDGAVHSVAVAVRVNTALWRDQSPVSAV